MTTARPAPILPLALILTVLLTAWWAVIAHRDLAALRLAGADDMLRLAQVRDWIDGQRFADLTQARLGPPGGTALASSRLGDLIPAAAIRLLSPVMGLRRAEIASVIFWPELLFFLHLLLTGAIARRLGGASAVLPAMALGALAFPAIAPLMPGHIAGQGLQLVLAEAMALTLLADRLPLAGAAAGAALLAGVDVAPVIAVAMLWLASVWTQDQRPITGFCLGLLGAALAGLVLLRPEIWPQGRCDGFTEPLFAAMLVAGGAWAMLGAIAARLPDRRWRVGAALTVGILTALAIWLVAPSCVNGFAADPLLASAWPSPGELVAYLALPILGLIAAVVAAGRPEQRAGSALLAALIAAGLLAAAAELPRASFAAAFAPPLLALLFARMRRFGPGWQIVVSLAAAGLVWQTLGAWVDGQPDPHAAGCTSRETLAALDRLDTGMFAAPEELGGYLIGRTQHRSLSGPSGGDRRGHAATAAFFAATPEEARYQANLWTIDYVALCPTETGGLPRNLLKPDGLAAHLLGGATPDWLEPVGLIGSELSVWRVRGIAAPGARP